ncbi:flagellar protein FlgN [Acidomonas methanolica]|uniref:Flagellar protein FlgN n=1 Tax=Acidomonas methanolica NBRC 104435 TaxID=1231351 RepID=A0A023D0J5_ACIMT|nr:flagellar protein FlgN [Acidomonas methanolica]MBU2653323.1 flagellar protein FlgN [Acidomonas methanolica]TCS32274.1 hypothetical protein EDC31_101213 [Acidomonas methanolica]GAJ27647.1 hypothetical protein Amme_005_035 [Acidomonas methanolica NBRC 104435]GBQ54031.1 hypothetical protein AA0498_2046 [Acidomonas methanolica]GEK97709.1 hypothetical protein AME01nite_02080 [Acidomonas methanolica NBRC 104435]
MKQSLAAIEAICTVLTCENTALEKADFAEVAALLPAKREASKRLEDIAANDWEPDIGCKDALARLADLTRRNGMLLRQAIAAQDSFLALLTRPPPPSEKNAYSPTGTYLSLTTTRPVALSIHK